MELASGADEVLAAVLVGGREKLPAGGVGAYGDIPVRSGGDPRALLDTAILELAPDEIVDLSDEPVLDYRRRHELISIALYRGVPYRGMDFRFTPPERPHLADPPEPRDNRYRQAHRQDRGRRVRRPDLDRGGD